jgi:hypothetical protein
MWMHSALASRWGQKQWIQYWNPFPYIPVAILYGQGLIKKSLRSLFAHACIGNRMPILAMNTYMNCWLNINESRQRYASIDCGALMQYLPSLSHWIQRENIKYCCNNAYIDKNYVQKDKEEEEPCHMSMRINKATSQQQKINPKYTKVNQV